MTQRVSRLRRFGLLSLAVVACIASIGAQGRGAAQVGPPNLVRQVRIALGHGEVADARRLAESGTGDAGTRALAAAVVDIFEGKYDDARTRLTPLAAAAPLGDASLELGLLDLRTGRRVEGVRRLRPLTDVRTFSTLDDYLRLARAAEATREYQLALDGYVKAEGLMRPDVFSMEGDMWLLRHKPGDAVTNYRKALEIDARWVPAMIGLARALADENPAESLKALAAVRAQAPDYSGLWIETAARAIDEDVPAATQALDELARVKPNSIEEAAYRAALAYKEGGVAAVEAVIPRVRAIDPTSALGYRLAAEQAATEYRFDDSAALARKGTEIDSEDGAVFFDLGLALMRTGDETNARAALEKSWDLDISAPLTKNLLDVLDHLDTFEVVPHNDFIFKFAKEQAAVLKIYVPALADEAYRQYVQRYGLTPKGPIVVEVFPEHDDFAVRTLGLPGLVGALGACFGRVVTMDSPTARPPGDFSWQATLWHELAHVFTLQLSDYRVPRWLTEGVSVYEEHRRQPAWGRELSLEFAHQLAKGENFGVKKLPNAFKKPETLSLAYFESALLVEHLVAVNGEAGLRTLLVAYAGGAKDADAFAKAFGQTVDQVETSFSAFLNTNFGSLRDAMREPPTKVAADDLAGLRARADAAPNNFISQMALAGALLRLKDEQGARAPLERAAALAPQAQGEDSARALLANIVAPTDPARARQLLRELLTYDHTNVTAARQLASLAAKARATDEEDFALQLVADLDPFDADTHSRLGARLLRKNDNAAALLEFQATLALGPANPAEAHSDLAEVLIKLGRRDEARKEALAALKVAPTYARAQDLLLAASGN